MTIEHWDTQLNIITTQERDWQLALIDYHRLEATEYIILDYIKDELTVPLGGRIVDMGCGSGRALFYFHYHLHNPVCGVELHPTTFEELEENRTRYMQAHATRPQDIQLIHGYANHYQPSAKDAIYYCFNPFSVTVFKQVVANLIAGKPYSKYKQQLILYYPEHELIEYLDQTTPLTCFKRLPIIGREDDPREVIYFYSI